MLNKAPPTQQAINEAKLKKVQQQLNEKNASTAKNGTNSPQKLNNTPRLIMDNTNNNKIPLIVRQRYLKVIFENGRSSFPTIEKACEKAAEQEKSIYDRAKNKTIYTNLVANLVRSLRNMQQSNSNLTTPETTTLSSSKAIDSSKANKNLTLTNKMQQRPQLPPAIAYSHEAMLSGPKANKCTYSINRVKQIEAKDLSGSYLNKK